MLTLYGFSASGNCHKVRLLLEQLRREYRWVEVDSAAGETRTPAFLAKNPNGKVPVIELDDGRIMAESDAILCWLADGTPYFAGDSWQRAQALSWMFFEQYSHEPCIAVARFIRGWTPMDSTRRAELPALRVRGYQALTVMERHLLAASWFTGVEYGIADIALFGYTDVATEGGFDLARFPAIRDWLARVRNTPDFMPMPPLAPDAAALIAQST
jgi:glutathione S-transferase